jgi:CheY-like chemotaxis protein
MSEPAIPAALLVDDSEDDVFFMLRAMKEADFQGTIHVARDGKEAKDYLEGTGPYADRQRYPLPRLMLLDLKLPYLSGLELLQWLRTQPELGEIIVIVLTSSQTAVDLNRAFQLGANSVLEKPPTPGKIRDLVRMFRI